MMSTPWSSSACCWPIWATTRARSALEKVLRQSPDRVNTRRRLVEVATNHLGRFSDATVHLQDYLLKRWPDNGELLTLLGKCQGVANDNNAAVATFQRAIENAPDEIQAYQWLAMILGNRTRTLNPALEATRLAQADQYAGKLISANPNSSRAYLAYAQYVTDLMQVRSMDEAWKHPILRNVTVPAVLNESIRHALARSRCHRRSRREAFCGQARSVDPGAEAIAEDLPHRSGDRRSGRPVPRRGHGSPARGPDPARLAEAADKAVKDLQPQLQADDNQALEAAQKHGLLAEAMKSTLGVFDSRGSLMQASRFGMVDEAMTQVLTARRLVSENTRALALASEKGILADASSVPWRSKTPMCSGSTGRTRRWPMR